jgi:precorrin-8X/cobalt-precorrin-8 methylmutase
MSARGPIDPNRDPAALAARAQALIAAEVRLDHLPDWLRPVAIRMVLACGMVDLPNRLAWSEEFGAALTAALARGAPLLVDDPMLAAGIEAARLRPGVRIVQAFGPAARPEEGGAPGGVRADLLEGAVVVIGSDALALDGVLDRLGPRGLRPSAILGLPVGVVGAAEAKARLAAVGHGVPYLTQRGRRGGAALAAAAINALAAGRHT